MALVPPWPNRYNAEFRGDQALPRRLSCEPAVSKRPKRKSAAVEPRREPLRLRIVGGTFRGRKLLFHGEPHTRPMKDRVREAIFNLLGPGVKGLYVIDLFAGTGALGLEALSRGATGATFVEHHFPTADVIQQNIDSLNLTSQCRVVSANTFLWIRKPIELPATPWLVLCSPPFDCFVDRCDEMLGLIGHFFDRAPDGSRIVVESDERFDPNLLPDAERWDVRTYLPAVVGIYRKELAGS